MNKALLSLGIAMVLCMGAARAQVAVFDPANFQQNLLTAARTLEQINNQVRSLQNETQMLVNQGRNLTELDFSALQERSEEHTSELQSLMRISYAVFCLKK